MINIEIAESVMFIVGMIFGIGLNLYILAMLGYHLGKDKK